MLSLAAYPILGPSVHPSRVILINYILSQNRNIASFFVRTGNFMDIETIEQELNERFAAPLPEYYNRDMIGVFRLESQMTPGNGKFDRTGLGTDRNCKESVDTAYN